MKDMMDSEEWEARFGGLKLAEIVILQLATSDLENRAKHAAGLDQISTCLLERSTKLMEDKEFRVRKALGPALGALARLDGALVLQKMRGALLKNIKENVERSPASDEKPAGSVRYSHEAKGDLMHDTEGWRSLDTSVGTFA